MEVIDIIVPLLMVVLCIVISAFFAGAETAVTGMSQSRLFQLIQEGNTRARRIGDLLKDKEALIGALLLGNSAVHIVGSAMATSLAIKL